MRGFVRKGGLRALSGFLLATLALSPRATAQSVTLSRTESCGSKEDASPVLRQAQQPDLTVEEVMEIAEEEIERTAQEAVKAALVEVGGEVAYLQAKVDVYEDENAALKLYIEDLERENRKKKIRFFFGGLAVGVGVAGIAVAAFTASP